ncbi:hypothetical protein [Chitinophaga niabensis]|uniref:Uncharacterized protein n=1 Tax=Chitinophaga niabensis TaxID=536979 RepID=A0A1N6DJ88_9BACT|nr:hypothetical protein [Chitinophaga niabensis]SIN70734.1 hypothetical protein SAMN04488055_0799 [Chitinophaga niabensis]
MAVSEHNVITRGATGTFGKQIVFRQRNGKTVMCKPPCKYPPKTATQVANQERFKRANNFAKAAVKDPERKAYYKSIAKPHQTAFNAAFQDAYNKPEVTVAINKGTVVIKTKGKHRIKEIKIITPSATGFAVFKNKRWEYPLKEKRFTVEVHDIAGNICTKQWQT